MRFFVCLVSPQRIGSLSQARGSYEELPRSRGYDFHWKEFGHVAVLVGGDAGRDRAPLIESEDDYIAVGTVRLDNRREVERWLTTPEGSATDLRLVLRLVKRNGVARIAGLLGDFAFLVWDTSTRAGVAACDAFGVKKLYYTQSNALTAFASRGETLDTQGQYDVQYLAELTSTCIPSFGLTAYSGVKAVPAGTIALITPARAAIQRFWSPRDFEPTAHAPKVESVVDQCRQLLIDSVKARIGCPQETWANLSGGLDSSSVVSLAQWLAWRGEIAGKLGGTVTYVDGHGTGGDERVYSEAVVDHWRLANETIIDAPVWCTSEYEPPYTDEPGVGLVFYPRDRRLCQIVQSHGGNTLLTGGGGDTLFTGNMFFFADWVSRGRLISAAREMTRRAAVGRASFWELAYRNALLPLLPRLLQCQLIRDQGQMPPWISERAVQRYDLRRRASASVSYAGRLGHKYHDAVAAGVEEIPISSPCGLVEDTLDVRHPFLFRPLVEFALCLPPELCVRPHARKWILRQAMRGILPEPVRTRVGKGTNHGLLAWSLTAQRMQLAPLLQAPVLGDLGIIDVSKLRAAFAAAERECDARNKVHGAIQQTLAIEAWLQMRAGRWPQGSVAAGTRATIPYPYSRAESITRSDI